MKTSLTLTLLLFILSISFSQECSAEFFMIGSGYKCGSGHLSVETISGEQASIGDATSGFASSNATENTQASQIGALPEGTYMITLEDGDQNSFKLTPVNKKMSSTGLMIHGIDGDQSRREASMRSIILDFGQRKKLRQYFDECGEMKLVVRYR